MHADGIGRALLVIGRGLRPAVLRGFGTPDTSVPKMRCSLGCSKLEGCRLNSSSVGKVAGSCMTPTTVRLHYLHTRNGVAVARVAQVPSKLTRN